MKPLLKPSNVDGHQPDVYWAAVGEAAKPEGQSSDGHGRGSPADGQSSGANGQGHSGEVTGAEWLSEDVRKYYYPNFDMDTAARTLRRHPVGTFLLRPSQLPDATFTLSIRGEGAVYNVRIYKNISNNGYHLDTANNNKKCFDSLPELINHFYESSRGLKALCVGEDGVIGRTDLNLKYPLSQSLESVNTAAARQAEGAGRRTRPVSRQTNGGSLKAMVKWL